MPEFTEAPSAKARMEADLERAEQWGEDRRAGRIRDKGCDSVSSWLPKFLAENPTAAEALRREDEVSQRAE